MTKIFNWLKNERVKKTLLITGVMLSLGGIICLLLFYFSLPTVATETIACDPVKSSFVDELVVDIGGAVQKPGIYRLANGQRLADLVAMAGGFVFDQVDAYYLQKSLNLAEILVSEKKYYIPYSWEKTAELSGAGAINESDDSLISINNANLKSLMTLTDIGEVRGQAIIDNRPYTALEDLMTKEVITEKIFNKIRDGLKL